MRLELSSLIAYCRLVFRVFFFKASSTIIKEEGEGIAAN